jgi:hypothetical protein
MLYRHKQGTFEVCSYKATYTVLVKQTVEDGMETIELEDGTNEEYPIYKTIEVEEQRENYVHDKEQFELTLQNSSQPHKDLSYENVILSYEQQQRYEEIRSLPESSIGHCIEYVESGVFPEGINHALRRIQVAMETESLNKSVVLLENLSEDLTTENASLVLDSVIKEMKIEQLEMDQANLTLELIGKGVL